MVQLPTSRRFSVDEYYRMVRAGILHEDDRIELIEGEIVQMPPIGSRHAACIEVLTGELVPQVAGVARVRVRLPVHIDEYSEPEPDLALVKPRAQPAASPPGPGDVLVAIGVSDTTFRYDRTVKGPLYARAGIPEYWIIDLRRQLIVVFTEPVEGEYRASRVYRRGERLSPSTLPQVELAVDVIFG